MDHVVRACVDEQRIFLKDVAMKKISQIILMAAIFIVFPNGYAMSTHEICEARAAIMYIIAQKRDSGESKKQIKRYFQKKFNNRLPDAFDIYVDSVLYGKEASPSKIQEISLIACYKEFGIRDSLQNLDTPSLA